jgi:chromosome segregation ATPase
MWKQVVQLQNDKANLSSLLHVANSENKSLESRVEACVSQNASLSQEIVVLKQQLTILSSKEELAGQSKQVIHDAQERLRKSAEKEIELKSLLEALTLKTQSLQSKLKDADSQIARLNESIQRNQVPSEIVISEAVSQSSSSNEYTIAWDLQTILRESRGFLLDADFTLVAVPKQQLYFLKLLGVCTITMMLLMYID